MSTATRLTVEAYLAGRFPPNTQLVHGEVVINQPTARHQRVAFHLARRLAGWAEQEPGRGEAGMGIDWTVGRHDVFVPDVWWVAEHRRPPRHAARVDAFPDLVAEVRSASTWRYDLGPKRSAYERAGVAELWLVDLEADTVLVNRRSAPGAPTFDVLAELGRGEVLATPLLPGFALEVAEVFDR